MDSNVETAKIVVRKTTLVSQSKSALTQHLTRTNVSKLIEKMSYGTFEATVETADANTAEGPLAVGDKVQVQLVGLEFSGLASMAQVLVAAKVPEKIKPMIEKTEVFAKVGESLDKIYVALRNGLKFKSEITEWNEQEEQLNYVDEGRELPMPLKSWRHSHEIADTKEGTGIIVDEITVEVAPKVIAPVIEGVLNLHLELRSKAYKAALEALKN